SATSLHVFDRPLRAKKVAAHIEVEDLVVKLGRGLAEIEGAGYAGIVDQDVKASERVRGVFDNALRLVDLSEISLECARSTAKLADCGTRIVRAGGAVRIVDHDIGPLAGELDSNGLADTHARAGYHRQAPSKRCLH